MTFEGVDIEVLSTRAGTDVAKFHCLIERSTSMDVRHIPYLAILSDGNG
jgi:hypothetical protein